ncbi:MAG: LysR family transcriptional regulator [Bacillota bacterium]|nr:LysR family transcriptional regulator [Bacillota bacterium]
METRNLYYLICVAEEKSISKAAEKLFITQPTLSQHIHKMEKSLGVQLFDRTTTPLSLTYSGEKFVEFASKVLEAEREFMQEIADINGFCKGRLTIGISAIHGSSLLPTILPKYKERFPGIEIVLMEENSHKLEEMAERGKTDITIANLPIQNENLTYETLTLDEVVLAVPKDLLPDRIKRKNLAAYDRFTYEEIEISELKDCPFLLLKPGHKIRQIGDAIFEEKGIRPRVVLESVSIETLYGLTSIGMGVTFIPKSLIPKEGLNTNTPLYFFSLRNPATNYCMVAAYNKHRHLPIAARKFISLVKDF